MKPSPILISLDSNEQGRGNEAAKALLERYEGIRAICQASPEELAECQVNGKRLGKAKAAKIAEVLG